MSPPLASHACAASVAAIARIAQAPRDKPFVVAQLGQSLDGRIATLSGESQWINGDAALDHVHALRAAVDAVIVGVGTVVADNPRLNVRRIQGRNPARVVIDPTGRIPPSAQCLAEDGCRRIVVCAEGPDYATGVEVVRIARQDGGIPPKSVIAALWERGLKTFLIEGGARTISGFLDAGAIDRLHVLVAPVILGSGKPGISLEPIASLTQALRPMTHVHVLADGDVLFDCDLRSQLKGVDHGAHADATRPGRNL
ncbi:MAG TPA: RibD family protein [Hyphomicrobiaceae bacterium]|nr:RibD family protein [Hyphomicrobiaceae bacterium]